MDTGTGAAIALDFPRAAFSVEAVKRAAYMLMAQFDAVLTVEAETIHCTLTPARVDIDMRRAEQVFRREVLDQDLRLGIEAQTATYRDTILGLAFSKTGLQDG